MLADYGTIGRFCVYAIYITIQTKQDGPGSSFGHSGGGFTKLIPHTTVQVRVGLLYR
jgi:hypothetical protein